MPLRSRRSTACASLWTTASYAIVGYSVEGSLRMKWPLRELLPGLARPAFLVLVLVWATAALVSAERQFTWLDETNYVVKSWWYLTGAVQPYSSDDATWYMPGYFLLLGLWQIVSGHDLFFIRLSSVALSAINLVLFISFLRKLGADGLVAVIAGGLYVLPAYSLHYGTAAAPYALANLLTLCLLHVSLALTREVTLRRSLVFGSLAAAIYFVRPNLIAITGPLTLWLMWRAASGRALLAVSVLGSWLALWGVLALAFGHIFVFFSIRIPLLSDILNALGLLPSYFPYVETFPRWAGSTDPTTASGLLLSAFDPERLLKRLIVPHGLAVIAAIVAACLVWRTSRRRDWILLLLGLYLCGLASHHIVSQLYCQNCIQAYANYFNLFAFAAAGLAVQSCFDEAQFPGPLAANAQSASFVWRSAWIASAIVLPFVHAAALALTGQFPSPQILNWKMELAAGRVRDEIAAFAGRIPEGARVGVMAGRGPRTIALKALGVRFHPTTINLGDSYFKIRSDVSESDARAATAEFEGLTLWTDSTAERWITTEFDVILVEARSKYNQTLPWRPDNERLAPLLARHFTLSDEVEVGTGKRKRLVRVYRRNASVTGSTPAARQE